MILIIDDQPDIAEAICYLLHRRKLPCEFKSSGTEGLAFIRSHPPDSPLLVLLDHIMLEMPGLEVLEEIRGDPSIASTTVVMLSAGLNPRGRSEAIKLGAVDWLVKDGGNGGPLALVDRIENWYTTIGGVKAEPVAKAKH